MDFKLKIPKIKKLKLFGKKKKKTSRRLAIKRKRKTKAKLPATRRTRKISKDEKFGKDLGKLATGLWKSQSNPGKVYVGRNRIHHGLVGAALTLLGAYEKDDKIIGFGKALMKDDIDDLPRWLDFEDRQNFTTGYA